MYPQLAYCLEPHVPSTYRTEIERPREKSRYACAPCLAISSLQNSRGRRVIQLLSAASLSQMHDSG